MQILVKLPSRQRHSTLLKVVEMYATKAVLPHTRILVTLDNDDGTHDLAMQLRKHSIVGVEFMYRTSKIGAVNHGLKDKAWDVVLAASDDMWPVVHGYDRVIAEDMARLFPDMDGCLWYHDGQQSRLCTLPVIGRKYFDRHGEVYFHGFRSYYADDFMHDEAVRLGRMSRMLPCIIRHEHHFFGGEVKYDGLYSFNRQHKENDRKLYNRLRLAPKG